MSKIILLVAINSKYIHSNLAIRSLYAYAREYRDIISTKEYTINQDIDDILSSIYEERPDVIAFSCYIWNIEMVEKLADNIRNLLPDVGIWLGGPEVSYNASEVFNRIKSADIIISGEGEETFLELVKLYNDNDSVTFPLKVSDAKVEGAYIQGNSHYPGNRELTDISKIPFCYNDLSELDNRIIYYESSRGCPFRCSYCLSSIDKKVRLRDIELVKEELQFFLDKKVKQVKFVDRTFNCNKEHALSIWKYILEHDNGITNFHFEIAADLITDEEMEIISRMRPGLIQFEIGVQSTNIKTIKEIRRVCDYDRLRYTVDKLKSFNNVHIHLDLIAGLPFETYEIFENSFNDVYSMMPEQLQLGFLKVLSGTYMMEKSSDYGLKNLSFPPYEVVKTKWISYEKLVKLKEISQIVEIYYNSNQFRNTLKLLTKAFETPFKCFEKLAEYYKENDYFVRTPSRVYRYEVLLDFLRRYDADNEEVYKELLTYDVYLRENAKSRPSFSNDLSEYKDEMRAANPDKIYHVEVFRYPVWEEDFRLVKCRMETEKLVTFDYSKRSALTNDALISVI